MLLDLLEVIIILSFALGIAIAAILVNGKHDPSYYANLIYITLGVGCITFVFYKTIRKSIKNLEDWQKEKDLKQIELEMQKLKIEEIKLKGEKK